MSCTLCLKAVYKNLTWKNVISLISYSIVFIVESFAISGLMTEYLFHSYVARCERPLQTSTYTERYYEMDSLWALLAVEQTETVWREVSKVVEELRPICDGNSDATAALKRIEEIAFELYVHPHPLLPDPIGGG